MDESRGICWHCDKLDMRDIRVAGRPQVSFTCPSHFRVPNVERCPFYVRLVGGDDDAPTSLGQFCACEDFRTNEVPVSELVRLYAW
jgi:hypothetical protein